MIMNKLVFLKLGGSLISDKNHPYKIRSDKLNQGDQKVILTLSQNADFDLKLGQGSGFFGVYVVNYYIPLFPSLTIQKTGRRRTRNVKNFRIWFPANNLTTVKSRIV
jgi:isopentenyl phosphate kinase